NGKRWGMQGTIDDVSRGHEHSYEISWGHERPNYGVSRDNGDVYDEIDSLGKFDLEVSMNLHPEYEKHEAVCEHN
ncbi:hypothetical protein AVEN_78263-1, partial [Araneus ventricosus]